MSSSTTTLHLVKPSMSEAADVSVINSNMDIIDSAYTSLLGQIYPVGSIYISVLDTNPSTLFGGTWEAIEDTFLLAAGSNYGPGTTGGEATHQLTISELPRVQSSFRIRTASDGDMITATGGYFSSSASGNTSAPLTVGSGAKAQQQMNLDFGGNTPHNNMPPYLAVYVWKRTA